VVVEFDLFVLTLSIFTIVKAMCEFILYPKYDIDEYHKLLCIRRDCNNCGISKLQLCPSEVDPNNEIFIPWEQFENVFVGHFDDGGDQHAIRLVSTMTPPFEFLAFLKLKLNEFVIHNFETKWQDAQFKSCLDNLTNDQIVIVIDFF
jgi:hypothetical protein